MSRVFEKYVEQEFGDNPYAYAQQQQAELDAMYEKYSDRLSKWKSGEITLLNGGSVKEWVYLGRPKNPII